MLLKALREALASQSFQFFPSCFLPSGSPPSPRSAGLSILSQLLRICTAARIGEVLPEVLSILSQLLLARGAELVFLDLSGFQFFPSCFRRVQGADADSSQGLSILSQLLQYFVDVNRPALAKATNGSFNSFPVASSTSSRILS